MEFIDISLCFGYCFPSFSFFTFHLSSSSSLLAIYLLQFILLLFSSQFLTFFFVFLHSFGELFCVLAFCAVKLVEWAWRGVCGGLGGGLLMGWLFVYLILGLCHDWAEIRFLNGGLEMSRTSGKRIYLYRFYRSSFPL